MSEVAKPLWVIESVEKLLESFLRKII